MQHEGEEVYAMHINHPNRHFNPKTQIHAIKKDYLCQKMEKYLLLKMEKYLLLFILKLVVSEQFQLLTVLIKASRGNSFTLNI
jgi:hypothetical protein